MGIRYKKLAETGLLLAFDCLSVLFIFFISYEVRFGLLPLLVSDLPEGEPFSSPLHLVWITCVWLFFMLYEGLYTKVLSFWEEIIKLWKVSFLSTFGVFAVVSIGKLSDEISRIVITTMGILSVFLLPVLRLSFKSLLRRLDLFKRRVLILGAGETGKLVAQAIKREPNYGYRILAFIDDAPDKAGGSVGGIRVAKGIRKASLYVKKLGAQDVIIAMPSADKELIQSTVDRIQPITERVLIIPDLFDIAVLGTSVQHFLYGDIISFEVKSNLSSPLNLALKRTFDITVSLLLLPLVLPLMGIIALLIRAESKGSAIFTQSRVGKGGKEFKIYKFRTMYEDAEQRLKELLSKDPKAREEWKRFRKIKNDPRITRVGAFLRRTSLDELPQIINVLKGEMSLVGPRPVTAEEIREHYREKAVHYYRVPPGLTGLWQVMGRSNTSYDYRVALDVWYVRNWNPLLDVVILLKTVKVVLKREGAY